MTIKQGKINDFGTCLKFGLKGESMFDTTYGKQFMSKLNQIIYETDGDKQRAGYDFEYKTRIIKFDIKTRNNSYYKYKDILIETVSVDIGDGGRGTKGWYYKSESEIIAYGWLNEDENSFKDIYYVNLENTRAWLDVDNYQTRYAQNKGYKTHFITVPISEFPDNCLTNIKDDDPFRYLRI